MSFSNLFLLIMVPITFLFLFIYFIYVIFYYQNNYFLNQKGISVFQLDLHNRKVKKISFKNQKNIFKFIKKNNDWIKLKNVINQIKMKENYHKLYLNTIYELEKKPEYKFIEIKGLVCESNFKYLFKFKFYPESSGSDFILSIEWRAIKEFIKNKKNREFLKNKRNYIKTIDDKKIVNTKAEHIGFLSLNMDLNFENSNKKIKKLFHSFVKKNIHIFQYKEITSLIYMSNNKNKVINFLNKTKPKLEKKLKFLGLNDLYNGSAKNIFKNVNNNKNYFTIIKLIRYYLIISNQKKIHFISDDDVKYEKLHFAEYIKHLNTFNNDIKLKNLISNNIFIKNYKTNKKIINYAYPEIASKINKKMFEIFLKNPNYKSALINSHIEFLNSKNKNLIVDINVNWLLTNYKKIKNKKLIYIIDSKQLISWKKTQPIIFKMQEKNFLFAIKISSYDTNIGIYIKKLKPKFIIIKKLVWDNFDANREKVLILLIIIKFVSSRLNIKLIYEDPPKNINITDCKKIGLTFSYNFK